MGLKASNWAWQQTDLRPLHKFVLVRLADRIEERPNDPSFVPTNRAWPSYESLSADTGMDRKTIVAAIKALRDRGLIVDTGERSGATGQVVVYLLAVKESQKRNDSKNGTVPFLPSNSTENGTLNSTENGTRNLPSEPTKEPERVDKPPAGSKAADHCPYQKIIDSYHENFPSGPQVSKITDKRRKAIAMRWREILNGEYRSAGQPQTPRNSEQALKFIGRYFGYCESLPWCTGRKPMRDGGFFRAAIDNLMGAEFMAKRSDEAHDCREAA